MSRGWGVVSALVVCGCLLSGCVGQGEAEPSPTISYPPLESPSVTPSPSVSAPAVEGLIAQPEDPYPYPLPRPGEFIGENSQRGAEQFAFYYIEQLGYFNNTNDVSVMEPLTHPDCETCWTAYKEVNDQYAQGNWGANLQYAPLRVWEHFTDAETSDAVVIVLAHASAWLSYGPELAEPYEEPAQRFFMQVNVRWDGQWRATEVYSKVESP